MVAGIDEGVGRIINVLKKQVGNCTGLNLILGRAC